MTDTLNRTRIPLRDVLDELSLAKDIPDAELLDEFVRNYPEHADAITGFAIELVVDFLRSEEPVDSIVATTHVSPAVSRAMSKYQNALHARLSGMAAATVQTSSPAKAENPFAVLDRKSFRTLAQDLNANSVFLCKLRDRLINPATITDGFRRFLADKLNVATDLLDTFFSGGTPRIEMQFFKAEQKPAVQSQQKFEDAVRSSELNEDQQRFLLSL